MKEKKKPKGYWDKAHCKEICDKFKTIKVLSEQYGTVCNVIRKNGWLDELTAHFDKKSVPVDWKNNKELCIAEAKKYNSRSKLSSECNGAYIVIKANNWDLEAFAHMGEFPDTDSDRLIYCYIFPDNSVYVGLTQDPNNREYKHKNDNRSTVYQYIQKSGLEPEHFQLTNFLPVDEAQKEEAEYIEIFRNEGYNILNKIKAGGIGGGPIKYTKARIIKEAKKYNTKSEFCKGSNYYYVVAREKEMLDDLYPNEPKTKKLTKWNYEKIKALGCKSRNEIRRKYPGACEWLVKNNKLAELFPNKISKRIELSKKEIIKISKDCISRSDFRKRYKTAYRRAVEIGILNKLFPYLDLKTHFTFNQIKKLAKGYEHRSAFKKDHNKAYIYAKDMKWLDKIFKFHPGEEFTFNQIKDLVKHFTNRTDFSLKYNKAYRYAKAKGWLDKILPNKQNKRRK
jgi:hypothetical protein